jgi:hypothetical protein
LIAASARAASPSRPRATSAIPSSAATFSSAVVEQLRQVGPALGAPQQARQVERRLGVLDVDLERLAQVLLGLRGVGLELHVDRGRRHVHAGRQAAIRRGGGFLDVLVGELLPVRGRDIKLGDGLGGHGVVGPERAHLLEHRARGRHVEQVVVEHHALLEQQIDLAIEIRRGAELDIDQLHHGVGAPPATQHLAHRREPRRANIRGGKASGLDQPGERLRVIRIMLEGSEERGQVGHRNPLMLPAHPAPDNADNQFLRGVTAQAVRASGPEHLHG